MNDIYRSSDDRGSVIVMSTERSSSSASSEEAAARLMQLPMSYAAAPAAEDAARNPMAAVLPTDRPWSGPTPAPAQGSRAQNTFATALGRRLAGRVIKKRSSELSEQARMALKRVAERNAKAEEARKWRLRELEDDEPEAHVPKAKEGAAQHQTPLKSSLENDQGHEQTHSQVSPAGMRTLHRSVKLPPKARVAVQQLCSKRNASSGGSPP
ncbi:hypothetical protein FVE85_2382 [Porphyridium purpureum]|uniref:Uncharacterized protein n=1 Tax=Porphyridium purpureum TaxID=35688 RepID=A0A5J4Z0M6_PORPP|nr:hypothetical protein FVE85_2382 [Porphyridium purpureum]|eukprot:POR8973..scf209_3